MNLSKDGFIVSTDKSLLDIAFIHQYLQRSYWATGIPLSVVEKSIEGSLCFGVFYEGLQVGFARVITDTASFAYLADFFIDENHRGQG